MIKTTIVSLLASQESMLSEGLRLGLNGDALEMFKHACDEVDVYLVVNTETGITRIVGVRGLE